MLVIMSPTPSLELVLRRWLGKASTSSNQTQIPHRAITIPPRRIQWWDQSLLPTNRVSRNVASPSRMKIRMLDNMNRILGLVKVHKRWPGKDLTSSSQTLIHRQACTILWILRRNRKILLPKLWRRAERIILRILKMHLLQVNTINICLNLVTFLRKWPGKVLMSSNQIATPVQAITMIIWVQLSLTQRLLSSNLTRAPKRIRRLLQTVAHTISILNHLEQFHRKWPGRVSISSSLIQTHHLVFTIQWRAKQSTRVPRPGSWKKVELTTLRIWRMHQLLESMIDISNRLLIYHKKWLGKESTNSFPIPTHHQASTSLIWPMLTLYQDLNLHSSNHSWQARDKRNHLRIQDSMIVTWNRLDTPPRRWLGKETTHSSQILIHHQDFTRLIELGITPWINLHRTLNVKRDVPRTSLMSCQMLACTNQIKVLEVKNQIK